MNCNHSQSNLQLHQQDIRVLAGNKVIAEQFKMTFTHTVTIYCSNCHYEAEITVTTDEYYMDETPDTAQLVWASPAIIERNRMALKLRGKEELSWWRRWNIEKDEELWQEITALGDTHRQYMSASGKRKTGEKL